jgi:hypothetical protein
MIVHKEVIFGFAIFWLNASDDGHYRGAKLDISIFTNVQWQQIFQINKYPLVDYYFHSHLSGGTLSLHDCHGYNSQTLIVDQIANIPCIIQDEKKFNNIIIKDNRNETTRLSISDRTLWRFRWLSQFNLFVADAMRQSFLFEFYNLFVDYHLHSHLIVFNAAYSWRSQGLVPSSC